VHKTSDTVQLYNKTIDKVPFTVESRLTKVRDSTKVALDLNISNPTGDLAAFRKSNPAGTTAKSGFGENLFWGHRKIQILHRITISACSATARISDST